MHGKETLWWFVIKFCIWVDIHDIINDTDFDFDT